jgi:hypothetical protein
MGFKREWSILQSILKKSIVKENYKEKRVQMASTVNHTVAIGSTLAGNLPSAIVNSMHREVAYCSRPTSRQFLHGQSPALKTSQTHKPI